MRRRGERLADAERRLASAARNALGRRQEQLRELDRALRALSPKKVLERGYAVLLTEQGRAVRAAAEVKQGERLRAELARGKIDLTVTATEDD